jgi:hypothetical protein
VLDARALPEARVVGVQRSSTHWRNAVVAAGFFEIRDSLGGDPLR